MIGAKTERGPAVAGQCEIDRAAEQAHGLSPFQTAEGKLLGRHIGDQHDSRRPAQHQTTAPPRAVDGWSHRHRTPAHGRLRGHLLPIGAQLARPSVAPRRSRSSSPDDSAAG